MKTLYLDCFSGISGDMLIGALIDAGLDFAKLCKGLESLNVFNECKLIADKSSQNGVSGTSFDVLLTHEHGHEHGHDHHHHRKGISAIEKIITDSTLSENVKKKACEIFSIIAKAEAKVHNTTVEEVHFHEVGAVDAIVDICAACLAFEMLEIEQVECSRINLGGGSVSCAHGVLPVPPPAVAELIIGMPCYGDSADRGELTTPTGAAIAKAFTNSFGDLNLQSISSVGYGFGKRKSECLNALRVFIGESKENFAKCEIIEVSANIDDMTGEDIAFACEQILQSGARDVYIVPIIAKKGRPAQIICALCKNDDLENVLNSMMLNLSTIGIRYQIMQRIECDRDNKTILTSYGNVDIKQSSYNGISKIKPEHDQCVKIASEQGLPIMQVKLEALNAKK